MNLKVSVGYDQTNHIYIDKLAKIKYIKNIDTPCDYFECIIFDQNFDTNINYIDFYIDDEKMFSGIIDKQIYSFNSNGKFTSICARSTVGALLVDNEAMPRVYQYPKFSTIVSVHGYQYGIKGLNIVSDRSLPMFTVVKGTSEWDVIKLFANQAYGTDPYIDTSNNLCVNQRPKGKIIELSNDFENSHMYSDIQITHYPYKKLSHVYICKDDGTYSLLQNEHCGQTKRRQFYVPSSQWTLFPRWSVNQIINKSMEQSFSADVTLPYFLNCEIGNEVMLKDFYDENDIFNIKKIVYLFDEKYNTVLTLGRNR